MYIVDIKKFKKYRDYRKSKLQNFNIIFIFLFDCVFNFKIMKSMLNTIKQLKHFFNVFKNFIDHERIDFYYIRIDLQLKSRKNLKNIEFFNYYRMSSINFYK